MKKRTLILIRHGHRSKDWGQAADNGLSATGEKQAQDIRDHWEKKLRDKSPLLITSPKIRCRETLQPLAEALGARTRVFRLLDEQGYSPPESHSQFLGRIRRFIRLWNKSENPTWVACSHGDWIPQCLQVLGGEFRDIKKGEWVVV